ncbi:conjugal transfer protein TraG N-terminal domain-containing protein [uncultured Pseudoteredinibacter sp.]|uniref:conjugal transfer protein TraG N-terminal domain-containing protein n=1 Tax=uncultured Pseudoteredinibacter sp. TaxID=1641701 RepID=UPI0026133672|nr:conjugal transfer protein TraG N-terminal domain-containing protein [uncultured Pseudoteredinibacter sp.]
MAVDSTLELYTTLFGWLFYNQLWSVLSATGLVFLPFLGILLDTVTRQYANDDVEEGSANSLRQLEVEFFLAFLVVVLAAVPSMPLRAVDLSFTPQAIIGTAAQPVATVANSRSTFGGGISFQGAPNTVQVPAFWMLVMSLSSGLNRAVMEAVPPSLNYRTYLHDLRESQIKSPELRHELNDFYRDCFVAARSRYIENRPNSSQAQQVLTRFGITDPDWLGSRLYRQLPGYYNQLRSKTPRKGYPWVAGRDIEWSADNAPTYGKPYCSQWWLNIEQSLLAEAGDIALKAAAAEPGWDSEVRRDAVLQILLLNSPPRWTSRGYDFAYGNLVDGSVVEIEDEVSKVVQTIGQQGLAAYGLATTSISFATYLRVFLEGAPMMQALVLMGLYALLPLFILLSRYRLSSLFGGALALFTVKFWTVLWFFAWWVDQNLIQALYPEPGHMTTMYHFDLTLKRVILNFLTGSLYIVLPLILSVYAGLAGARAAGQLSGVGMALTAGAGAAKNARIPMGGKAKMAAKAKK